MSARSDPDEPLDDVAGLREVIRKRDAEIASLKEQVKATEQSRVEYMQNVAHQLIAPLNAIKWHIENLTSNRLSLDRGRKVLRSIYSQSTIAVHLAKNFVFMSNLEADHTVSALKEPVEPVGLQKLLFNLADDFQPLGWDKNVHISVDDDVENLPNVMVIKNLISQVFSNIIENAVKYSDPDTTIRISGSCDGDDVTIAIRNRGIPLADADKTAVFDRGFRSSEAKNKHPAGTGFGLYIAGRIVDIHGGDMRAYSDNKDTVFEVILPIRGS